jgi:pyruvate/2-oxoglutarate dehydrogenase complex dihydrolipoamide acyltransferase (E2) component
LGGSITSEESKAMSEKKPSYHVIDFPTVGITAVGMFGKGMSGWGLVPVMHVLDLVVGSTARKPAVVEGRIEPREILNLTVVFDHDVIDGAPAARFARRLVELIEGGFGLDEDQAEKLSDDRLGEPR